jgi:1,4-alpha-glucan branching enzyme
MRRKAKTAAPATETGKTEALKPAAPEANRVSLELVKPEAKTVFVAGSFNQWKPETTPLARVGDGRWAGALAVKPGRHEYLFVVDGQWLPDPNAKESVQNPFGGRNSVLVVSE